MRFDENAQHISVDGGLKYIEMNAFSNKNTLVWMGLNHIPYAQSQVWIIILLIIGNWSIQETTKGIIINFAIVQFVLKLWLIYALW